MPGLPAGMVWQAWFRTCEETLCTSVPLPLFNYLTLPYLTLPYLTLPYLTFVSCTCSAHHVKRDRLQELAEQLEDGKEGTLDEKLGSALDLTHALNENGEYNDAVNLGKQTLATFREVAQPDDPNLLHALGMLAHAYASFVAYVLCR